MKHLLLFTISALLCMSIQKADAQGSANITIVSQIGNEVVLTTDVSAPVGNTLYQWNFGDVSSSQQGPTVTHNYVQPGTYIVDLMINDSPNTFWYAIDQITLVIGGDCNIISAFSANELNNGVVNFTIDSVANAALPVTYSWWFSDGQTSFSPSPYVTFTNGNYTACLTVTDANWCVDTICSEFSVIEAPCQQDFITSQIDVNENEILGVVLNQSLSFPIQLWIEFGDGTFDQAIISSAYTFTHTYPAVNDTFDLCFFATDNAGCTDTLCNTVITTEGCNINSSFSANNLNNGVVGFNVNSVENATPPYTYYWWFSNGQQSTAPEPVLTFPNGNYTACLTIEDANGCFDSTCTVFNVTNGLCQPDYILAETYVEGDTLFGTVFNQNFNSLPVEIFIDYGDGTFEEFFMSTAYGFEHIYPSLNETFTLCIYAVDNAGCADTICYDIITGGCENFFATFTQIPTQNNTFDFIATSSSGNNIEYFWDFGDGTTFGPTNQPVVSHTFPFQGAYNVCLIAVNPLSGCEFSSCQLVTSTGPCGSLFVNPSLNVSGLSATINAFATGGCSNYSYDWSIPSLGLSGNNNPFQVDLPSAGLFTAVIVVSDDCGCTYTSTVPINISCQDQPASGNTISMQNGSSTTCSSFFTDPAGANGNYANNQDFTLTIYPSTTGAKLKVDFTSFNTEQGFDELTIRNGNSVSSPLLAVLDGNLTGTNLPEFTSTAADGSLTFIWHSDISIVNSGWIAILSCVDLNINTLDLGDNLFEFTVQSNETWESYEWSINGTANTSNESSIQETFTEGEFVEICLTAVNALGCETSVCTTFVAPCNYQLDVDVVYNGNQVNITINNPLPDYFYSVFTPNNQFWQQIENGEASFTFMSPINDNLCIYADGPCFDSTCVPIQLDPLGSEIVSGFVWDDANGNGLFDENEMPMADSYVTICAGTDSVSCLWAYTDENGYYEFSIYPGTYTIQSFTWQSNYVPTLPADGQGYTFTLEEGTIIEGFDFGYQLQAVVIEGIVFYDNNNNGIRDAGENGVPSKLIQIGNSWVSTNALGEYSIVITPGTYEVSVYGALNGYVVSAPAGGSYSVNASVIGQTYSGNDFGLWADPELMDLSASISPISTITPGFNFLAFLDYCNNGASAASGTFTFYWDPLLDISSASEFSPQPTSFNPAASSASWDFTDLAPGDCDYIYMSPPTPVSLALGTAIFNTVVVTPLNDYNPANNIDTLHQTVVGSYDPNDKQGVPAGIGEEGRILPNTQLAYTIRFQNTGTAPAVNVVLIDTISTDYILETFQMVASSDEYSVNVNQSERTIRWTFTNIMLPDSTSDPEGSIGFVNFKIDPVQNQIDGTVLNNFADIYFDFNEPIRTNTTVHTIDRFLSISEVNSDLNISIYPNPFSGTTSILVNSSDKLDATVSITDMLGKELDSFKVQNGKTYQYHAEHLASGMYMYTVTTKNSKSTGKMVVR
ncbi:MAG: PKD domain-containing protein [Bacteroidia bacterium]